MAKSGLHEHLEGFKKLGVRRTEDLLYTTDADLDELKFTKIQKNRFEEVKSRLQDPGPESSGRIAKVRSSTGVRGVPLKRHIEENDQRFQVKYVTVQPDMFAERHVKSVNMGDPSNTSFHMLIRDVCKQERNLLRNLTPEEMTAQLYRPDGVPLAHNAITGEFSLNEWRISDKIVYWCLLHPTRVKGDFNDHADTLEAIPNQGGSEVQVRGMKHLSVRVDLSRVSGNTLRRKIHGQTNIPTSVMQLRWYSHEHDDVRKIEPTDDVLETCGFTADSQVQLLVDLTRKRKLTNPDSVFAAQVCSPSVQQTPEGMSIFNSSLLCLAKRFFEGSTDKKELLLTNIHKLCQFPPLLVALKVLVHGKLPCKADRVALQEGLFLLFRGLLPDVNDSSMIFEHSLSCWRHLWIKADDKQKVEEFNLVSLHCPISELFLADPFRPQKAGPGLKSSSFERASIDRLIKGNAANEFLPEPHNTQRASHDQYELDIDMQQMIMSYSPAQNQNFVTWLPPEDYEAVSQPVKPSFNAHDDIGSNWHEHISTKLFTVLSTEKLLEKTADFKSEAGSQRYLLTLGKEGNVVVFIETCKGKETHYLYNPLSGKTELHDPKTFLKVEHRTGGIQNRGADTGVLYTSRIPDYVTSRGVAAEQLQSEPVSVTSVPASVTSVPASVTSAPASVTSVPASVTSAPVSVTSAPVSVTSVPVSVTSVPVSVTSVPASVTSAPASVTSVPASVTSAPVSVTSVPVSVTSVPASVTSVPEEAIVVLLDCSSSMNTKVSTGLTRLDLAKILFKTFVDRTKGYEYKHILGLTTFTRHVNVVLPLQSSLRDFEGRMDGIATARYTVLWDALQSAAEQLIRISHKYPTCVKRIICLTDGEDNRSTQKPHEVAGMLQDNGIVVDCVLTGKRNATAKAIAIATNGCATFVSSNEEALRFFQSETVLSARERVVRQRKLRIERKADLKLYENDNNYPYCNDPPRAQPPELGQPVTGIHQVLRRANTLKVPIASKHMHCIRRLLVEIKAYQQDPHPCVEIYPCEEQITFWRILLSAPQSSLYEGGVFLLYAKFPKDYPKIAPEMRFVTPIYHCNINSHGRICHSIFKRNYSLDTSVRQIIDCVYGLLLNPEIEDPLDSAVAETYHLEQEKYIATARSKTKEYADKPLKEWRKELIGSPEQISDEPPHLLCPLTQQLMRDPVITPYGNIYDRSAIERELEKTGMDPKAQKPLSKDKLFPAEAIRMAIDDYKTGIAQMK